MTHIQIEDKTSAAKCHEHHEMFTTPLPPSVRVDKRDGRSSRGSYYRPVRIEEELAEMSDVEEEPEEEEEPEVEVPPADYDVEEDPDNVVIRPPPSDDEDM